MGASDVVPGVSGGTMAFILGIYEDLINAIKSFDQDYIMIHEFATDIYEDYYTGEKRVRNILGTGTILSIIIVILGIYALVSHNIISRPKEIGIRKVNGATILEILVLLNKDYLKLVALAFVLASPLAWYAMQRWLENFAFKTNQSWWIYAIVGLLTIGLSALSVSWKSWRAATKNPIEALRYE